MKCKLLVHTFLKTRKVVIRRKKNLSLETLMPEESETTCEKSRVLTEKTHKTVVLKYNWRNSTIQNKAKIYTF